MNKILEKVKSNSALYTSIEECEKQVTPILQKYITNFPDYTDHSIEHSKQVLEYATYLIGDQILNLNEDEAYILIMACYLHDIGMCPTKKMKERILSSTSFEKSNKDFQDYLRDIHHELSYEYVMEHWEKLNIINEKYAEAIGLVGKGHRVVDLFDSEIYKYDFPVRSGTDFVCLPFLSGILRLADELDITNDRTPKLLFEEYFPDNIISRKEWKKHKANYFVNFKNDTIIITSKCTQKELFYALVKHYKKIEGVLNYVQKLIRSIPISNRNLSLDFSKLERNIETQGFIPKEIGFSFDLQNTIDTFIGDNLYNNEFVAIRECIQNAIDSCRLKKKNHPNNFTIDISVTLKENRLVVSDNGLGMDDFIVENYFSKLAKSFYNESRIAKNFVAISQFGIGVFSYFLLCDYFLVETKMEGNEPLKFRVNKDADGYFHFFDDADKKNPGTEITFFLREKINFETLTEKLKHYFRFLEFPIHAYYKERKEIIARQNLNQDYSDVFTNIVKSRFYNRSDEFTLINAKIENDKYEGIVGLLIGKDNDTFKPISLFSIQSNLRFNKIELSEKGVFVNEIEDFFLEPVSGKLNLKEKEALTLSRDSVKNNSVLIDILRDFHKTILDKIFQNWKNKERRIKADLTKRLIRYHLSTSHASYSSDIEITENQFDNLIFTIYDHSGKHYLSLKELLEVNKFILFHDKNPFTKGRKYDFEDISTYYDAFKTPLLLENNDTVAKYILSIFKNLNKKMEIISSETNWHYLVNNDSKNDKLVYIYVGNIKTEGFKFHNSHIAAFPHLDTSTPLNIEHDIIKYYLDNYDKINQNQILNDLFEDFFSTLHDFLFQFHNSFSRDHQPIYSHLTKLVSEIDNNLDNDFKLTPKDFPDWINNEIEL